MKGLFSLSGNRAKLKGGSIFYHYFKKYININNWFFDKKLPSALCGYLDKQVHRYF